MFYFLVSESVCVYTILYKALFHNKKDSKQIKSYCYKFKLFKYLKNTENLTFALKFISLALMHYSSSDYRLEDSKGESSKQIRSEQER